MLLCRDSLRRDAGVQCQQAGEPEKGRAVGGLLSLAALSGVWIFSKCRITYPQTNKQHQKTKQQNLV